MLSLGVAAETGTAPLATGLAIGTQAALLFGVCALLAVLVLLSRYRSTLTRYHVPALLLLALAVSGAFGTAVGYEQTHRAPDLVEYTVEQCELGDGDSSGADDGPVTTVPGDRTERQFESLSPEAQEVFVKTLRNGGTYSVRARPPDLRYEGDTEAVNYVRYESTCYALVGESANVPSYMPQYLGAGLLLVVLFLSGWWSLRTPRFRFPTGLLAGLGTAFVAVTLAGPLLGVTYSVLVFVAASLAGYAAAQGALGRLERRRGERFSESMTAERTRRSRQ